MPDELFAALTLARVLRPWGRRGEVAAEILTDFPERLVPGRQVWLADGRKPSRSISIVSSRLHSGQLVILFAGVSSIDDAEKLRGLEVQVPLSERVPLPAGRYYISDLIGCAVWEENAAAALGSVREVRSLGKDSWLLAVTTAEGELLIPMASEICTKVDLAARRIEVRLPEGLREVNQ